MVVITKSCNVILSSVYTKYLNSNCSPYAVCIRHHESLPRRMFCIIVYRATRITKLHDLILDDLWTWRCELCACSSVTLIYYQYLNLSNHMQGPWLLKSRETEFILSLSSRQLQSDTFLKLTPVFSTCARRVCISEITSV